MLVREGQEVKWRTGRKTLGVVVRTFPHKSQWFAIVENSKGVLSVVRITSDLIQAGTPVKQGT